MSDMQLTTLEELEDHISDMQEDELKEFKVDIHNFLDYWPRTSKQHTIDDISHILGVVRLKSSLPCCLFGVQGLCLFNELDNPSLFFNRLPLQPSHSLIFTLSISFSHFKILVSHSESSHLTYLTPNSLPENRYNDSCGWIKCIKCSYSAFFRKPLKKVNTYIT